MYENESAHDNFDAFFANPYTQMNWIWRFRSYDGTWPGRRVYGIELPLCNEGHGTDQRIRALDAKFGVV